jgi:DNA-binding IclR family transcriptional regulator
MVHSPDGRSYELLPRVLAVGHAYLAGTPLAKVAQTALDIWQSARRILFGGDARRG